MQLNSLKAKTPRTKSQRVGRGGKRGKTSGRGTKGQKARAGRKMRPEMRDLIKKLPKLRGHGVNRARTVRPQKPVTIVTLASLDKAFEAGDTVTPEVLLKKNIIRLRGGKMPIIKILNTGMLSKNLNVSKCTASESAKKMIESKGGSVL